MSTEQADTATDQSASTDAADSTIDTVDDVDALREEVAKWKAQARKHEDRAKANMTASKELESLRQQTMTETERAIAEASAQAVAETTRRYTSGIVAAEIRAAAAGRDIDVTTLLEAVDPTAFVGDSGEVDTAAVAAWVSRLAPPTGSGFAHGIRVQERAPVDPLLADLKSKLGIN